MKIVETLRKDSLSSSALKVVEDEIADIDEMLVMVGIDQRSRCTFHVPPCRSLDTSGTVTRSTNYPPRAPNSPLDSLPPVREGLRAPPEREGTAVRGVQDGEL